MSLQRVHLPGTPELPRSCRGHCCRVSSCPHECELGPRRLPEPLQGICQGHRG